MFQYECTLFHFFHKSLKNLGFLGLRATPWPAQSSTAQSSTETLADVISGPVRRNPMLRRTPICSTAQSSTDTLAPETLADAISRLADFLNETETLAPAPGTLDDATALEELRRSKFNLVLY